MKKILSLFVVLIATCTLWAGNVITYTASSKLSETTNSYSSIGLHTGAFNVSITSHTFSNGTGTITFSGNVTSIGKYAFWGCSGLTSVTIPNSVTSIGDEAFYYCSGLTSVTIPNSVTYIGEYAFYLVANIAYNGSATGLPWGARCVNGFIDGYLIYSNASRTQVCACIRTATGSITIPNSVTSIGDEAFYYCTSLTSITIPNSVTSIGGSAFYYCTSLTSITIPNSVTSIGLGAFYGCSNLTSITISNSVTSIGDFAFYECTSLTSVTIPNSVTSIGDEAFEGCSGLTSVTIPNSVTSIGGYAFYGCEGLTSIIIPSSVTSIGWYTDWSVVGGRRIQVPICSNLTSLVVESGNLVYDSRDNCNAIIETASNTLIEGCKNTIIPNSVTSIGYYAFNSCSGLTSITIPNSVTSIGGSAFKGCEKLKTVYNLSDLDIIKGATTHGYVAYYADNVYVPLSVSVLSSSAQQGSVSVMQNGVTMPNDTVLFPGSQITIKAIPNTGYQFNSWSDGNTDSVRTITITQAQSLTANFGVKMCTLTIVSNIELAAFISGAGTYAYGTEVSCVYYLQPNYRFVNWGDGSTANPYRFNIYDDMTLDIFFEDASAPQEKDSVVVTPSDNNADIQWPQVENAMTYTMTINKEGKTILTMTFNGQGQLVNINITMAPALATSSYETQTANGFSFNVTGLSPGTTYSYCIEARDENGELLSTETGTFTTTGEPQSVENVVTPIQVEKFLRNGQILIQREGKTYDLHGQVVE